MARICLVIPPIESKKSFRDVSASYYIGVAYLAGSLATKNIDCKVIDAKGECLDFDETVERLRACKPDIVAITAMTNEIARAGKLASKVKKGLPGVVTLAGGAHARTLPRETLDEFPGFDLLCTGEGEIVVPDLVSLLEDNGDLSTLRGIAYRKNGQIIVNPPAEFITDLDTLPFPGWGLFFPSKGYPILSSRGCPFECLFCNRISGRNMRYRSAANIVEEIEWLKKEFDCERFHFQDEVFTVNKKKTTELLDLMIEKGFSSKTARWGCVTRADCIDLDLARKMKEAGCHFAGLGIETGSQDVLTRINKKETMADIEKAVDILQSVGIKVEAYYIFGHPHETKKEAWDTIKFAARLNTWRVSFGMMVPYPGTEIYRLAEKGEGGYTLLHKDWGNFEKYVGGVLRFENMSREYMERLQIIAYLYFYIRNLRVTELLGFCKRHIPTAKYLIKSKVLERLRPSRG